MTLHDIVLFCVVRSLWEQLESPVLKHSVGKASRKRKILREGGEIRPVVSKRNGKIKNKTHPAGFWLLPATLCLHVVVALSFLPTDMFPSPRWNCQNIKKNVFACLRLRTGMRNGICDRKEAAKWRDQNSDEQIGESGTRPHPSSSSSSSSPLILAFFVGVSFLSLPLASSAS